MIPVPKVAKVSPRCAECGSTDALIGHAPRFVCIPCVQMHVNLGHQDPPAWIRRLRGHQ
jgi:ribosomal protein S27AE